MNLGGLINTADSERSPALSADGLSLYFATTRPGGSGGFDIWVAHRTDPQDDFGWQAPVNLGPLVNSPGTDAGPNYFVDPVNLVASLYFASARPEGMGGLDIYRSGFTATGSLGAPSPVTELNSPGLDLTPALRADGLEIIFASNRSGVTGLWMSTRADVNSPWETPVSLGPTFQIGSEAFPALSSDGTELYFYSSRPGGIGSFDLYRSARTPVPEPGALLLTGTGVLFVFATSVRRRF
jgi:Tol biopolymer transport system component